MRTTKEAELNAALLHFAAKCLVEGDEEALADLGLDRTDAEAIKSLHLTDIDHLNSIPFALLRRPAIDRALYRRLIEHIRHLHEVKTVRDALLALDAPLPMMQAYFGMEAAEYAELGRRLKVTQHPGRPPDPSDEEERTIWHTYQSLAKPDPDALTLDDYLALCQRTNCSARTVWTTLHRSWDRSTPANPLRGHGEGPVNTASDYATARG
jgi:uncharacterized protein YjiS (DUF1127 family)